MESDTTRSLQALNAELQDLRRQLGNMSSRVNRVAEHQEQPAPRTVAMDRLERSQVELAGTVGNLAHVVMASIAAQMDPNALVEQESQQLRQANAKTQERKRTERLRYAAYLKRLRIEKTYICPCGKHMGMRFIDDQIRDAFIKGATEEEKKYHPEIGIIEVNVCPADFWFTLSRLAFEEGLLKEFRSSNPLTEFLSTYNIPEGIDDKSQL